ncbi:hypothetical protein LSTR_LSTR000932 [Laodelphax striatellus]|uniref:Uncharacterized protein n=1 Tax=Laodelphax striatellus TaxID=195883 RepID=A0A482X2F4_LAOST|nr:hypothetical protein LSTR_LSTR000932 [Laodelphax striatellus]
MLIISEKVPWKERVFLTSFIIMSLVGDTMTSSHYQESQTSLPDLVYNPFTDYMLNLATSNKLSEQLNLKQKVLKSSLIQELVPSDLLEKYRGLNWEFTTAIGIEAIIFQHFREFPSHKSIFDYALGLWRERNRDIMNGKHVENVGNPITESVSVEHEILQATLIETKEKLCSIGFENLISIINLKISLENLYAVLPFYRRIMFLKVASYFESGQLNDYYDLRDKDSVEILEKIANTV